MPFADTIKAVGIAMQVRIPVLLVGPPGNAKTSIIESLLGTICAAHETCIAALHEPAHFGGYPVPRRTEEGADYVALLPNRWVQQLHGAQNGEPVGLFLDELSSAPPATRAAALRGVLESTWGEVRIENLATASAMNPPGLAEGGYQLSAALANRFCHIEWDPPIEWWTDQQLLDFPEPSTPPLLPEDWHTKWLAQAKTYVATYARRFPSNIQNCPAAAENRGGPWPSFRTWHWARDLLAAALSIGEPLHSHVTHTLVSGCVGSGVALEFLNLAREMDLPDPEHLLAHPDDLTLPERGDRAYAILHSIISAVFADTTDERWYAGFALLAHAVRKYSNKADIIVHAAALMLEKRPEKLDASKFEQIDAFRPILKRAHILLEK